MQFLFALLSKRARYAALPSSPLIDSEPVLDPVLVDHSISLVLKHTQ
jgi:hypothetical protein